MSSYPLSYRARLWTIQRFSRFTPSSTQYERLGDASWDILIVLDACRYDTLAELASWPIDSCRSPASSTSEWLSQMVPAGLFDGTNVVAGNAKYANFEVECESIHHLWDTHWDDRLGIVPPEPTLDRADELARDESAPVVTHVVPPHAPYIGKVGETWLPLMPEADLWQAKGPEAEEDKQSAGMAMAAGAVDVDRARRAYRSSVASTWQTVASYIGEWTADGLDVVVTADHGETFGRLREGGLYAHPTGCHIAPLVRVPFARFTPGTTPETVPSSTEEKLQALGYAPD